jgi:hypothetical protein
VDLYFHSCCMSSWPGWRQLLLYPVYSSLFSALVSLGSGILSICFIRHPKLHSESQKELIIKFLPHKSIRSTRRVREIKCGIALFNTLVVHLRMIVLVKCMVGYCSKKECTGVIISITNSTCVILRANPGLRG